MISRRGFLGLLAAVPAAGAVVAASTTKAAPPVDEPPLVDLPGKVYNASGKVVGLTKGHSEHTGASFIVETIDELDALHWREGDVAYVRADRAFYLCIGEDRPRGMTYKGTAMYRRLLKSHDGVTWAEFDR